MDLIYGKRQAEDDHSERAPQKKFRDDLPLHLPNQPGITACPPQQNKDDNDKTVQVAKNSSTPIPGTDIVLETQEDIDAWIQKRKENWMKRISNKRQTDETTTDTTITTTTTTTASTHTAAPREKATDTRRQQRVTDPRRQPQGQPQSQRQRPQHHQHHQPHQPHQRFNLNTALLQRELSRENTRILDVIKELFDEGLLDK